MRLLKDEGHSNFSLVQHGDDNIPRYAILSHTWGADSEEVTFKDLMKGNGKNKAGYNKIEFCRNQAASDGLQHFWVDTCCINKANHAELSEAIVSMFRWYRNAVKCYVFLSDVSICDDDNNETKRMWESAFRASRWFTRGWTLQELIAPASVEFFSQEGERLGDKKTLEQQIHDVTAIPVMALRGTTLSHFSVDERMQWAAKRNTKRKEDRAYCLLGLFDIFMPLIYGEGENAFIRLSEEIDRSLKTTLTKPAEAPIPPRIKLDLDKLPYAKGAIFNSYDGDHVNCHPATRIDLLHQIYDWAQQPYSKSIFWLSGMAGTGKSTISWTVSQWLTDQGRLGGLDLGASFFFKRGEADRGSALRFFPTIVRQLVSKIPGLDTLIVEAINSDPLIFDKALAEQFDKLILQPLQKVNGNGATRTTLVVVVDALDECGKEGDIKTILQLWSNLPRVMTVCLRLFLTSRPDLPVRLAFQKMSVYIHWDMALQDAVPQTTIRHDLFVYLKDAFNKIREDHNGSISATTLLSNAWPDDEVLNRLVDMAVPLFIVAATVCRFVGDPNWNAQERLDEILEHQCIGQMSQMEQTYLPVLKQLTATVSDVRDNERLHQEFRTLVGSIVCLVEPLSVSGLATLLDISPDLISRRLNPLHAVLQVPPDYDTPIRTLHLSFAEFLLNDKLQDQPYKVDGPAAHLVLWQYCVRLLSGPNGLRENICDLDYPGQPRQNLSPTKIATRLPPAFQYACRYWVHHVQYSKALIHNNDEMHEFLQRFFLYWLEAITLINRIDLAVTCVGVLQSLLLETKSSHLASFLEDARRFVLANQYIVDLAPLQLYSSAIVFAPHTSIVRNLCGQMPEWIKESPLTPVAWSHELQKLEGHTNIVVATAFSPNGSLLVSASYDYTVRLWNTTTGQEVQKLELFTDQGFGYKVGGVVFSPDGSVLALASHDNIVRLWIPTMGQEVQTLEGHADRVNAVMFSPDGLLLASASDDKTVRLWNLTTSQEVQTLEGHTRSVSAVTFSPHGSLLASASYDCTVRLWNLTTGQEVQTLERDTYCVYTVVFSPDGSLLASALNDCTVRLWNLKTGQEVQILNGHTGYVKTVAFSPDGSLLASASDDKTVRLWNLTTGQEVQKLEGHTRPVHAVAFSPYGSLLASASSDKTIRLWDPRAEQVKRPAGHTSRVTTVVFSPDGSLLASASGNKIFEFSRDHRLVVSEPGDRIVRLWDPATGQEVQNLKGHTDCVNAVAFSSDGLLLASASDDKTVRLWNLTTDQVQILRGHTTSVTVIVFSPNSSLLASASGDWTIRLWDPMAGLEVQKLEGHTSYVSAVAFICNGSLLASASNDCTVRLWDLKSGQEVQKIKHTGSPWQFIVDKQPLFMRMAPESDGVLRSHGDDNLVLKYDWIEYRGRRILWLPQEYRSGVSAFHGSTLAIGQNSGLVSFLRIDCT